MCLHIHGDAHVYLNHVEGLKKQLEREPYPLPTVRIDDLAFNDIRFENIHLENYQYHPFIRFKVAV